MERYENNHKFVFDNFLRFRKPRYHITISSASIETFKMRMILHD